jgi:hypothetical protein
VKQVLRVDGWEDVTVVNDACGEMRPLNKTVEPSKRQESAWGDKTYSETISETLCVRQNYCIR